MLKNKLKMRNIKLQWVVVVILLISQLVTLAYVFQMKNQYSDMSKSMSGIFNRFVGIIELQRYQRPAIDVSAKKVYIPELKIFLPLNDVTSGLRYSIIPYPGSPSDVVNVAFSLNGVVGAQKPGDDPTCDQMINLSTNRPQVETDNAITIGVKKMYIYVHSAEKCNIYPDGALASLSESVKAIRQYQ